MGKTLLDNSDLAPILENIKNEVEKIAGDRVRVILFGSYARGDQNEVSDVDLMVTLPDALAGVDMKDRIRDEIYEFSLKTDFLFSVIIVTESFMNDMAGFKVFDAVQKEGVLL